MLQVKMLTPAPQTTPGAMGDGTPHSLLWQAIAGPCCAGATGLRAGLHRSVWSAMRSEICIYYFNLKLRPSGAGSAWFRRPVRRTGDRSSGLSG